MHSLIEQHRESIKELARQRGARRVRLFGSMLHGAVTPDSDVDVLVDLVPGHSALALGGLLMDLQDLLGRKVDVVTEASLHPAIRERILREAKTL
ncbi:MAG: nucleotidyltransferase family protein [Gammaproteobacteria bacterium]